MNPIYIDVSVDLAQPQRGNIIRIHEGDRNSVILRVKFFANSESFTISSSMSVKYDAVINNYLAEEDASADSANGNIAEIPITSNMTARSGKLLIDVKIIDTSSVVYAKTIELIVERRVLDGDVIIDISGTTISQMLDELNDYLERLRSYVAQTTKISGIEIGTGISSSALMATFIKTITTEPSSSGGSTYAFVGQRAYRFIDNQWKIYECVDKQHSGNNTYAYTWVDLTLSSSIDISGKVDKTTTIANIPLSSDISAADLGDELRDVIVPSSVTSNQLPKLGQFGRKASNGKPVFGDGASSMDDWKELALSDDIPTVPTDVSDFTNDAGYIPIYLAESAPPTGNTDSFYDVPCVWVYNDKLWLVWARNTVSVPGQTTQYYYTYQRLETIQAYAGGSMSGTPDFDGQVGFLATDTNKLKYGYNGSWYSLANESYVQKYAQHTMSYTLLTASWSSLAQTLDISSSYTVTSNTKVDIQIDGTAYTALESADCKGLYIENNNGTLTAHAIGSAPSTDITVQLTIMEVLTL